MTEGSILVLSPVSKAYYRTAAPNTIRVGDFCSLKLFFDFYHSGSRPGVVDLRWRNLF